MTYRTILVHVDEGPGAQSRMGLAAQLALTQQAHLIGAAMNGLPSYLYGYGYAGGEYCIPLPQEEVEAVTARANDALARFEALARQAGVERVKRRLSGAAPEGALLLQARYADLLVLSQSAPDAPLARVLADTPEFLITHCRKPVLLVPYSGQFAQTGKRALLAWDGSGAAARAIGDALPLLRQADKAVLAVFNPGQRTELHGEQPGADMALFLARHGVNVEVMQRTTGPGGAVGEALLSLADECDSDLLVMGAYGHLRLREILLGGVTRTVLESMTLPVLMSH